VEEYLKGDTLAFLSGAKQVMWIASGGEGRINVGRLIVKAIKRIWKLGVLGMAFYPLICAAWVCHRVRQGVSTPESSVFTGERTNPARAEEGEFQDHLARYLYAQGLIAGGNVLDLGCGDGYGSALLAEKARWVLATDISEEAVRRARRQYRKGNLAFAVMDATAPAVLAGRFDLVCAFEVIEHLEDPERFLAQVKHLLRPRGFLLLSTPNQRIFSPGMNAPPNPFHRVEFSLPEFSRLLARYFPRVVLYGMRNRERLAMDDWRYLRGLLKWVDPRNLNQRLSDEMRRWLHRKVASFFGVRAAQDVGPEAYCFEDPDPDVSEGFMAVAEREH
jgi:SAM-dependent methyltransferase